MEILGIDVGGSGIKGALVDTTQGRLASERHRIDTPQPATPAAVAEVIASLVSHFDWHGPVGCCFPARIKNGVSMTAANIDPGWIGQNVQALFSERTGCPFVIVNDADAAGIASMTFGAGKGRRDLVLFLTVGTGIGSALFIDGHLVPNSELGHIPLHGQSAELYASDRARKIGKLGWKAWAARFQEYLDLVEFLLAPDLIILGGGISKPKKTERFLSFIKTQAELLPSVLGNEAGIVGAACLARDVLTVAPADEHSPR